MRALVYDPKQKHGLRSADVPDPKPTPAQAIIEVHATSLNFGEVSYLAKMRKPGDVPGWDAAGIVTRVAADGSGPKKGARVSSFGPSGAWAELRVVETTELGTVPDHVDFAAASAITVAGVTALRALRALGAVVGRRVLITGASGGVGRFAVQLAHLAGAHVVAVVGSEKRGEGLRELGADDVVVGVEEVKQPVFGVLETVGGKLLGQAFALVEQGGSLQSIGQASHEPSTIDFEAERNRASRRHVDVFVVGGAFASDITYLASLVAEKMLDAQIGWRGDFDRFEDAIQALLDRKVSGKAVLDVRKRES